MIYKILLHHLGIMKEKDVTKLKLKKRLLMKIQLPSNTSAVFAGAVIMPVFIAGVQYLQKYSYQLHNNSFPIFIWSIVSFFIPFSLATVDFNYFKRTYGSFWYIFRAQITKEDLTQFFIPTWKRIVIWFVSAAISSIVLMKIGILKFN
jgi:hypothetical protein